MDNSCNQPHQTHSHLCLCEHVLAYCAKCDTVYCKKCAREWGKYYKNSNVIASTLCFSKLGGISDFPQE
jgi:hypothetical protein